MPTRWTKWSQLLNTDHSANWSGVCGQLEWSVNTFARLQQPPPIASADRKRPIHRQLPRPTQAQYYYTLLITTYSHSIHNIHPHSVTYYSSYCIWYIAITNYYSAYFLLTTTDHLLPTDHFWPIPHTTSHSYWPLRLTTYWPLINSTDRLVCLFSCRVVDTANVDTWILTEEIRSD